LSGGKLRGYEGGGEEKDEGATPLPRPPPSNTLLIFVMKIPGRLVDSLLGEKALVLGYMAYLYTNNPSSTG
jgi:hypothetical protein